MRMMQGIDMVGVYKTIEKTEIEEAKVQMQGMILCM